MNDDNIEFGSENRILSRMEIQQRKDAGNVNKLPFEINDVNAERLIKFLDGSKACKSKTNHELAILLLENIWAYIPMSSPVNWLLDEVISRLAPELDEVDNDQNPSA